MAAFIALIISGVVFAEASMNLHDLAKHPNIRPYQDPSRFIWNHTDAYLLRVSVPTETALKKPKTPCVRSRYWSKTTEKVERSLEVYNKTNHGDYRSINISLTVKHDEGQTILNVETKGQNLTIMNGPGTNIAIEKTINSYNFLVLFSDANCLILAEELQTERVQRRWLRCSMWLPRHRITKPPKCCLFIFELLCAYMDDSVEVFEPSCLEKTAKPSKST
uniref:Lipocalin n=1 Tax=Rhipicephalus appendiculatus TaxID=34631 RepID=A0A131Z612_RHIAP